MASESGFSNQKKLGTAQFKTIHNVGGDKFGQSVASKALYEKTAQESITITDVIGNSGQIEFLNIYYPAHNASTNDVLRINGGIYPNFEFDILSIVDIDNFLVLPLLPSIDISGELAVIMAWVTNKANADGSQIVTLAPVPLQFVKDSAVVNVNEDTVTPTNNSALPANNFFKLDGVDIPVSKDTLDPNNTIALPVEDLNVLNSVNELVSLVQNVDVAPGTSAGVPVLAHDPSINEFKYLNVDPNNDLKVSAAALPLPTGAATSAKQDTGNTSLSSIDGKFTTLNAKDFSTSAKQDLLLAELQLKADLTETQPVSLASVPLPTGAATEAKQDTGNTSLSGIGTNTVNIPNVITTEGGAQPTHGVVVMGHTGAGIARHLLVDGTGRINANVTASVLPTGASTLAEQQTQTTAIGSLTETAPATDTASSGLNGRLQRIAQRLTSLIALFPSSIGTKASTDSLSVVLASDQVAIGVTPGTSSGTITQVQKVVGTSAVRATVAGTAPSATRKRLLIKPSKNNTGAIYLGSSSVTTSAGLEIIGPDRLEFLLDASDYYLISDSSAQVAEIIEVI